MSSCVIGGCQTAVMARDAMKSFQIVLSHDLPSRNPDILITLNDMTYHRK